MNIKNVTIIGGGVLGSQIAFQSAYCGLNVIIYLREKCSAEHTKPKLENLKKTYIDTINLMDTKEGKTPANWARGISDYDTFNKSECIKKVEDAYKNIKIEFDLKEAVKYADLVIESMTENIEAKTTIFKKLSNILPDKTIIVTNSSTILPSKLAKYTGRENKFLSLHFANSIWKNNTAEVMRHDKTDEKYFNEIIDFAKYIKMIPLPLRKEKSGYLLNSMLIPLLFSSMDLLVNEISDIESIDSAWKFGTGSPKGPFEILDIVGLKTAYNIVLMYVKTPSFLSPYNFKGMAKMLKQYIDDGKLGKSSGEGFYKYNK